MNELPSIAIRRLDAMAFSLPEREIMARLGYRENRTVLSAARRRKFEDEFRRAFAEIRPRGSWTVLPILAAEENLIRCAGGVEFHSASLVRNFGRSAALWLGGVTVGAGLTDRVRQFSEAGDAERALVWDAVGSECADAAIAFLQQSAAARLRQSARRLTRRRFSPGYGDFSLENQGSFFAALRLSELGMALSERFYLLPEKSVTAVAGVIGG